MTKHPVPGSFSTTPTAAQNTPSDASESPQTTSDPSPAPQAAKTLSSVGTDQDGEMELLDRARVVVKLKDKDGKVAQRLALYEADGQTRDRYILAVDQHRKDTGVKTTNADGEEESVYAFNYFAGLQALLLYGNVTTIHDDGSETKLADAEIDSLGARVQTALNDKAKEIGGFTVKAEENAKNA